jgi:MFS transporter, UMF1 family
MEEAAGRGTVRRRERWAWYLYDFGNSAYAAVVLLAVYSAYFQGKVVGGHEGSRLWGLSVGIAMLVVAIISPVLGAIADYSASKKRFLFAFTALACAFTGALFFVGEGDVLAGMLFFILAEIGYRSAQVFYNGLLPEIAAPEEMGRVSGNGWAIGSAGGIVCLLLVLPLVVLVPGTFVIRLSLLITAVYFAAAAVPIFLWLPERGTARPLPKGKSYLSAGFGRLWRTLRQARRYGELVKFMGAFLVYNDGVIMALDFAAIIGAVLFGLNQQQLIIFVIIVQLTNVAGAWAFGAVADSTDCKRSLSVSILLLIGTVVWMYFNQTALGFYLIGAVAGFAMAGVQSVSRTMVGVIIPPGQSAEFFGLFAVAGRTSSFVGPAVYGWVAAEAARWYIAQGVAPLTAEQGGQRLAILTIALFLAAGLVLLWTMNEARARATVRTVVMEPGE